MRVVRLIVLVALLTVTACADDEGTSSTVMRAGRSHVEFHDRFDSNDAGWRALEGDARVRVADGALDLRAEDVGAADPLVVVPDALGDDLLDIEVAVGARSEGVGVVCRVNGNSWYAFAIADGRLVIEHWSDGASRRLAAVERPTGDESRQLGGRCRGGAEGGDVTLRALVDGAVVLTAVDPTGLGPGAAGVVAFDERVEVSEFLVAAIPDGTYRRSPPTRFPPLPPEGIADDFSDRASGFGSYVDEAFVADYRDGGYRLRAEGFIQRSAPADPMPARVVAEVTATKQSPGPGWYGLTWALDADHLYALSITDGRARIRAIDGRRTDAVTLAITDTDAVRPTGEPNRIRAELNTSVEGRVHLALDVNGVRVLEVSEPPRLARVRFSQLVVTGTRDSTEPVDVLFDDYRLVGT